MTLAVARGTQALIALENHAPGVLFDAVPGSPIPLWPQIRDSFAIALDRIEYPNAPVDSPHVGRGSAWAHLLRSFLPSRWDARSAQQTSPLCFLVSGTTVAQRGERTHNWLIGDFAARMAAQASVLQWRPLPSPSGSPEFDATWSLDPMATRSAGFARLSRRDSAPQVSRIVREIARLLEVTLPGDVIDGIATSAAYSERQRSHVDRAFARILDRFDPRVVVMKSASYGHYASIIAMMKDRGIHVAEPQHGWLGPTHAAYNFGEAMFSREMQRTLPDELLLFGTYWANGLLHPGELTVIGKPHLEAAVSRAPAVDSRPRELLVVSSMADPDEMSDFVVDLRAALPGNWTVVFRPHPAERATFSQRYPRLVGVEGVRVDERADAADALASSRGVVGVASTVLFEAVAFGCQVFVRDSPFLDYYVGDLFGEPIKGADGIERLVAELGSGEEMQDLNDLSEEMWASGSVDRFEEWASAKLAPPRAGLRNESSDISHL